MAAANSSLRVVLGWCTTEVLHLSSLQLRMKGLMTNSIRDVFGFFNFRETPFFHQLYDT